MPFQVKKSFIEANPQFEVQVAAHAKELRDWVEREKRVAQDAKNPNIPDIERWVTCPRPEAPNAMVDSAVDEVGNADYEIEDDGPTPEQILSAKKSALFSSVRLAEANARHDVMPMFKRPLRDIRSADIYRSELARADDIRRKMNDDLNAKVQAYNEQVQTIVDDQPGILKRAGVALGLVQDEIKTQIAALDRPQIENVDVMAEIVKDRSPEDAAFIAENEAIAKADDIITRNVAKAQHDIEDLTIDTVDQYRIPDLTKQG